MGPIAWLSGAATTAAWTLRLMLADGRAFGFTSHDTDLHVHGFPFRAEGSLMPSALVKDGSGRAYRMEVRGTFPGLAPTATDVTALEGARARLSLVDWSDPEAHALPVLEGGVASIGCEDGLFTLELVGAPFRAEAVLAPVFTPECRAELGDRRCRVDLGGRTVRVSVEACQSGRALLADSVAEPERYRNGRVRIVRGAAVGRSGRIADASDGWVEVELPVTAGDVLELREGCDKRLATCAERFGNAANFRGEPHVPGEDAIRQLFLA